MKIKTGIGFDVHKFCEGRKLFLGGIEIPYELGLKGHSDADVLIHAIIDAIVSPVLATDIGKLFPDTDSEYKDIDSKILLAKAYEKVKKVGYEISNIDCTVIAEAPKIAPYVEEMRSVIASILDIDFEDITIKGTSTEKLGFTGRKEGIAAIAVCTLIK